MHPAYGLLLFAVAIGFVCIVLRHSFVSDGTVPLDLFLVLHFLCSTPLVLLLVVSSAVFCCSGGFLLFLLFVAAVVVGFAGPGCIVPFDIFLLLLLLLHFLHSVLLDLLFLSVPRFPFSRGVAVVFHICCCCGRLRMQCSVLFFFPM